MTRRERLIKALIHFHHRGSKQGYRWKKQEKAKSALRARIAERNQYRKTATTF